MKKYDLSGFKIIEAEETLSTNTLAEQLPKEELPDKSVVLTFRQSCGRGQVGNKWESEPERNISLTVIFRPEQLPAGRQFAVSMVIALGCKDFVSRYVENCLIKWPNDIYVGDKKIAGILIEHNIAGSRVSCSLCGVGLNVNQREFLSDAPNPVSLWQLTGKELPLSEAVGNLLECIGKRYGQISDYQLLETEFLNHLYRRGGVHRWEDAEGFFEASVAGIDEYGRLRLVDSDRKERPYGFKEVAYR